MATRVAFVDQQGRNAGGAEESLALLLRFMPSTIDPVAVFFEEGAFTERIRKIGVEVVVHRISDCVKRSTRERMRVSSALGVPASALALSRTLHGSRVRVVHTNTLKAHLVGGLAARLAGLPTVSHLRDILDGPSLSIMKNVLRVSTRRRIAISRAVANCYGLGATEVIRNPIDLSHYTIVPDRAEARARLGIAWDGPIVGIVGRINRWKGHDRFLRIARMISERIDARFIIVGKAMFRDEDFERELHELVPALGLEDKVIFVPWLDDPRVAYAAMDVHCNCSTLEPFGRTTIEASATGKPTVCFDDGGAAEAIDVGVSGEAVAPGDERAFAEAVTRYLVDEALLRATQTGTREHARKFCAREHAERVAAALATESLRR